MAYNKLRRIPSSALVIPHFSVASSPRAGVILVTILPTAFRSHQATSDTSITSPLFPKVTESFILKQVLARKACTCLDTERYRFLLNCFLHCQIAGVASLKTRFNRRIMVVGEYQGRLDQISILPRYGGGLV